MTHTTSNKALRTFAVVSPTLMFFAVVFTANHWVIDGIVGTAICLAALAIAFWIRKATERPEPDCTDAADEQELVSVG